LSYCQATITNLAEFQRRSSLEPDTGELALLAIKRQEFDIGTRDKRHSHEASEQPFRDILGTAAHLFGTYFG
jgi:hypothetical protein